MRLPLGSNADANRCVQRRPAVNEARARGLRILARERFSAGFDDDFILTKSLLELEKATIVLVTPSTNVEGVGAGSYCNPEGASPCEPCSPEAFGHLRC